MMIARFIQDNNRLWSQIMQNTHIEQISRLLEDGLLVLDYEQTILYANAPASKLLGAELVNRPLSSVFHDVSFDDIFNNIKQTQRPHEFLHTQKQGVVRQFRIKITPMGEDQVGLLILDMTLQRNLDKMRRDFVANVSHELRSPLTALIGFIETMQSDPAMDEGHRLRFLDIMDEESQRMTRLIDDLISLSRVEVEEHILPDERLNLDEVLQLVQSLFEARAKKQNMTLHYVNHCPEKLPVIQGERDEIVEVLHNLIENAIKYGASDTTISLDLQHKSHNQVEITVTNYGEPIEERHIPRLTERFYRVDKARSRQKGGTGLGLAIVKHIINRHRGQLKIKSKAQEEGAHACTNFTVSLPLLR